MTEHELFSYIYLFSSSSSFHYNRNLRFMHCFASTYAHLSVVRVYIVVFVGVVASAHFADEFLLLFIPHTVRILFSMECFQFVTYKGFYFLTPSVYSIN